MFGRYVIDKSKVIGIKTKDLKNLTLVPNGDAGMVANVYNLDDTSCIKVFQESFNDEFLEHLDCFSNYDYDFVAFPQNIVSISGKYKAYTMRKVNGMMFSEIDDSFNYKDILNLGSRLQEDIKELSKEGFKITDCHPENIMLDLETGKFVLIDTDFWERVKYTDLSLVKRNFENFDEMLRIKIFGRENLWIFNGVEKNIHKTDYVDFYESFIKLFYDKREDNTIGTIKKYKL